MTEMKGVILRVFIYFEPLNVRQRLDRNIFGENRLTDKI